ncbi:DUF5788 family protein [Halococcoides cellulosivorans]|uniref:Uncharacterized protein n=1 Tax=Halococcoides cellulosivorans TaxID=1679096 RepID=A0A2R4X146_9EURY|nr:DUF5788 family protein [Halococcoides cellulosivorans]AWB27501.1 hypothetical protein HARCEL1_07160 [Halococcoides cellulosivorans]
MSGEPLDDDRRSELIDRVQRRGSTIGQSIPRTVTIDGTELALKEFVWETKRQGVVPPDQRDRVRSVRASLTSKRDAMVNRLRSEELSVEEAERIADEIVGIDRAIAALKNLREPDIAEADREHSIESSRRWVDFLDAIVGG